MFACLECEHCINTLLKIFPKTISLKRIVMLHSCTKRTSINIKFNVKYLHRGHKININFVSLKFAIPTFKT
jgi:hypothetical protein